MKIFAVCVITFEPIHTVAIWTFTFHKKLGYVKVILKVNFKPVYSQYHDFFDLKIQSAKLIFFLFFAGVIKSTAFCTQLLLFQKG